MVGVLTNLDVVSMFPAGGGTVRGPGRATVPYPEQVVNVRRGFGGDNNWIYRLDGDIWPKIASRGNVDCLWAAGGEGG